MTSRILAFSFGIAVVLGFGAIASAQEPAPTAPAQPKQQAADEAKKADVPDTSKPAEKADAEKSTKVEPKIEYATFGGSRS